MSHVAASSYSKMVTESLQEHQATTKQQAVQLCPVLQEGKVFPHRIAAAKAALSQPPVLTSSPA